MNFFFFFFFLPKRHGGDHVGNIAPYGALAGLSQRVDVAE